MSSLTGEQADMRYRGESTDRLDEASTDLRGFVAERVGVRERFLLPTPGPGPR